MGYGSADVIVEMDGGYTLEINWSTYPSATVSYDGKKIADRAYMMTGWFLIRPRITRWAVRSIKAHEKMMLRLQAKESA